LNTKTNKNRNQELGSGRCGVMAERKKRSEPRNGELDATIPSEWPCVDARRIRNIARFERDGSGIIRSQPLDERDLIIEDQSFAISQRFVFVSFFIV
jgi:hypothetical protein